MYHIDFFFFQFFGIFHNYSMPILSIKISILLSVPAAPAGQQLPLKCFPCYKQATLQRVSSRISRPFGAVSAQLSAMSGSTSSSVMLPSSITVIQCCLFMW